MLPLTLEWRWSSVVCQCGETKYDDSIRDANDMLCLTCGKIPVWHILPACKECGESYDYVYTYPAGDKRYCWTCVNKLFNPTVDNYIAKPPRYIKPPREARSLEDIMSEPLFDF